MYKPPKIILKNYSDVLVNFALGGGKGTKRNDIVYLQFDTPALPLAFECYKRILEKGAHPMVRMYEEDFSKIFYKLANDIQLKFFPRKYIKTLIDTYDHSLYLASDKDPLSLKRVKPGKIMLSRKKRKVVRKWMDAKEDEGKLTWSVCLYGTSGMAREAGITLKEYWQQITKACFLREPDPIKKWESIFTKTKQIKNRLESLPIEKIHITSENTDLWVKMGDKRQWMGGSGRNIPSFELFTSPDWRGTEGKIFFDLPLYRYGNIIKDIYLEFKSGKVTKAKAGKNEKLLKELIKQKNADKIGEFSLTDKRFSKIDKFMAQTLYDENFGGNWGNTHLALGTSYHDTYSGNAKTMKENDWRKLGFNHSAEHCDIMATKDRVVEAVLKNGTKKVIYKKGQFTI